MSSSKKSIKFKYVGIEFTLPSSCLRDKNYWGEPLEKPYISIGRKEVPLMFKQYVKATHPELLVWGKSQTFSGGCSSDLYACYPNGNEIGYNDTLYKELNGFCENLKGGSYNGMHDIYEYGENGKSDNGTELEFNSKYVSFNGKAPFGTWPEAKRTLRDMLDGKYVWGAISIEKAIEKIKTYGYTEATIAKAVEALGHS
jgi:hypothetical protein